MRNGHLLFEDTPQSLLQLYQCELLEKAVLDLCYRDNEDEIRRRKCQESEQGNSSNHKRNKTHKLSSKKKSSYNVQDQERCAWSNAEKGVRLNGIDSKSSYPATSPSGNNKSETQSESTVLDRVMAMSIVMWLLLMRHPV